MNLLVLGFSFLPILTSCLVLDGHDGVFSHATAGQGDLGVVPDNLSLIIDVKTESRSQLFGNRQRKNRRGEKLRRRKDKQGKFGRHRNKVSKVTDTKQILRNSEKDTLVRNRTIEILKNGVRILNTEENGHGTTENNTVRVNETLLEKILSSGVSKSDLLISSSGVYKVPIGSDIYKSKKIAMLDNVEVELENNQTHDGDTPFFGGEQDDPKINGTNDFEEYDAFEGWTETENRTRLEETDLNTKISYTLENIATILRKMSDLNTNCSRIMLTNCSEEGYANMLKGWEEEDPCSKWLECKDSLESVFSGGHESLPACPCNYPSTIFYDNKIWDKHQDRYFRWKDASSEAERLDVYKPGAAYCIRSRLVSPGSSTISSQQCCYDRELRLLTRGSGAGTVNFVSPDVSTKLHDTIDVLPWRLCKGDFTRYNIARKPDNRNNCPANPDDTQYQLQVEYSKFF